MEARFGNGIGPGLGHARKIVQNGAALDYASCVNLKILLVEKNRKYRMGFIVFNRRSGGIHMMPKFKQAVYAALMSALPLACVSADSDPSLALQETASSIMPLAPAIVETSLE